MKPAYVVLSDSAKKVKEEASLAKKERDQEMQGTLTLSQPSSVANVRQQAQEFMQGKLFTKPGPGSLLSDLDKRLEWVELGGEVARLEVLLDRLRKSRKYSSFELRSLTSKITMLKEKIKEKKFKDRAP